MWARANKEGCRPSAGLLPSSPLPCRCRLRCGRGVCQARYGACRRAYREVLS